MQKKRTVDRWFKQTKQRRIFKRAIALMCVLVILVTFNSTTFAAAALERTAECGYDYVHQHGPQCYDASGKLVCKLHVHTDACYQAKPVNERTEAAVEAPVAEAAEPADLPVEEEVPESVEEEMPTTDEEAVPTTDEEVVPTTGEEAASEPLEEAVDEIGVPLGGDEEDSETETEHHDDAPEAQPQYFVGDQYPFFLSDVLNACEMDIPLSEVVEIGQVLSADDAPQTLRIERIEDDYAFYTLEDCEDQELAIITGDSLMTVRLIGALVPQWAKAQTGETGTDVSGEQLPAAAADGQASESEELPTGSEPAALTGGTDETDDTEEVNAVPEADTEKDEDDDTGTEIVATGEPAATEDGEKTAAPESGEAEKIEENTATGEAGKIEENTATGEAGKIKESTATGEAGKIEESTATEDTEEPAAPEDTETTEENEEASSPETEEAEKAEENEAPEGSEADGETENSAPGNHTLIIDLSQVERYPLSLNAMLAHFQPAEADSVETTAPEAEDAEAVLDDALTGDIAVESETVESYVDEVEFELGEEAAAAQPEAITEGVPEAAENAAVPPSIQYDDALLRIEASGDDCLITPVASFERTEIVVEDARTILLLNSRVEETMPAQSFEESTDTMVVKVEAGTGAFPAGTTMTVQEIDDEDTLTDIGSTAVEEDFVEVKRVHAVDITFFDAEGAKIEPLMPISVVMSIRETEQDEETRVVHVDDDGNVEAVPEVVSATEETAVAATEEAEAAAVDAAPQPAEAPVESVSFVSDAFSVYAVVVTKKLETKIITAGEETYKITVTYAEDAAIPGSATLEVREIEGEEAQAYLDQAGSAVERQIALARFFDIRIMDGETEIQPAAPVIVTAELVNDEETDLSAATPCAVHFAGDEPNVVQASETEEAVTFKAESFSVWGVVYTVDFEYKVDGKIYQFSLPGGEKITLSDLIEVLGIIGDTNNGEKTSFNSVNSFLKEVANVEFSNESLVKVTMIEGDFELESLQAFDTEEILTITMKNGDVITVKVTDARESNDLGDFLTKVTVSGASLESGNYVVEPGQTYSVTMTFKETTSLQFDNENNLIYDLPSGLNFPAGTVKPITIAVVSRGRTYECAATVTTGDNGTVIVKFDESNPNYNILASATNVSFRVSIDAEFTENISKTEWHAIMDKDIILDTEDHSDVFAEKSGSFDPASGKFNYTIRVTSYGDTTNVNVKDIISGNALIFNNDVQITGNGSSYTTNTVPSGQGGFDYTFASMADGEVITITYSASLDPGVETNSGKVTADQTKNTVTVKKEGGDPHTAEFSQEINMKRPDKADGTEAGTTAEGNKLYNWTIDYNPLALVSAAGDVITDSIGASSQDFMKYYGDVTVKVYDHDGTLVDTRNFTPGSDSSWTYTVPTSDTTPYRYVFEYQTVVDQGAVDGQAKALELTNTAAGAGGNVSGAINVNPKEQATITKAVDSSSTEEIAWVSVLHVPEGGLNKAVVTDTLPSIHSNNLSLPGNYMLFDPYKDNSLEVLGLLEGETYELEVIYDEQSQHQYVIITFKKDGEQGLKANTGGHDITIKLKTKVDQTWLKEGYRYPTAYQSEHVNKININGGQEAEARERFVQPDLKKKGLEQGNSSLKFFKYSLYLSQVNTPTISIDDIFDRSLLEVYDPFPNGDWNKQVFYLSGGDAVGNVFSGDNSVKVNYSDTETGIHINANSVPLQDNGEYYPVYMITYFLKLKDGVNLDELAIENGGQYDLTNTATWGDHESSYTFTTKYDFLDKQILQEASATDRNVQYKITYNLKKGELNGGEDIQMTDRLNEHLSIDYTSIRIETDPAGITIPYSLSGDGPETVATYTIPDATAVTITYDAMVVGNGTVNYKNTVEAHGEIKEVEKTAEINIEGEGTGAVADLKITKVDGYDANKKLAGVKFKLYAADGRSLSLDESEDLREVILETDENGVLSIDGNVYEIFLGNTAEQSVKYYIEEVEAPDGYGTISFPYQFTLVDDIEGVDYEHYIYFFSDSFQIKNWPLERLVVGKNVQSDEAADHTRDFTFEVSILTEEGEVDTSINQKYGDMTFVNGVATFTLKDKEQVSAWSMPAGTRFKVEEKDADGFTVSVASGETTTEGAVFTGETSGEYTLVTFNNTKVREKTKVTVQKVWNPVPDSGSVTVELHRYAKVTQGTIHLTLTDQNGDPVPGAAFRLYKDGSAQEGTYTTNAGGEITVSNLDQGEYYLMQTAAPDGYSMGDPAPQTDTLTVTDVTTVQELDSNLTNTKLKTTGSASIILTSAEDSSAISGAGFSLYKDGSIIDSGTTNASGQLIFDNLAAGSYTVRQTSTDPDLEVAADQSFTISGTEDIELLFTNEVKPSVPAVYQVHLHGSEMNWNQTAYTHSWYQYYTKGTEVAVKFEVPRYQDIGGDGVEVFVDGVSKGIFTNTTPLTVTFTVDSNIEILLDGVTDDNYALAGRCMTFTPESNATADDMAAANTTSSKRSRKLLRMSAPLKAPGDSVPHTDAAPASAPAGYAEDSEFTPVSYTLTGEDWSYTFPEQDKEDADGNPYYYYVVETAHTPGDYWIDSYSGDPLNGTGTITITNKKEEEKGKLTVNKTWAGVTDAADLAALQAGFSVTVTGTDAGGAGVNTKTFAFSELPATIGNLPLNAVYSITESNTAADTLARYTVVSESTTDHFDGATPSVSGQTYTLVNTYERKVTDFEFSKIWKDIGGQSTAWPAEAAITVTLNAYADSATQAPVLEDQTLTFSPSSVPDGWTVETSSDGRKTTFKTSGLPAVNTAGDTLTYYVVEAQVTGYKEPSYADKDGNELMNVGKATTGQQIINAPEDAVVLPSTGGPGTTLHAICGIGLIALAVFLLLRKRARDIA